VRRGIDLATLILILLAATLFIGAAHCPIIKPPPVPSPTPTIVPTPSPSPTIPPPTPSPSPILSCEPPYDLPWICTPDCGHATPGTVCTYDSYYGPALNVALDDVRQGRPELFDASLTHVQPNDDVTRAKVFDALVSYLRMRGFCAGWRVDQVDIGDMNRIPTRFEGFHPINFGGGGLLRPPTAYRGFCSPATPTPSTLPTPGPTPPPPSPVPSPAQGKCPMLLPIPAGYALGLRISKGGQQVDATPFISNQVDNGGPIPPVGWTGDCRAHQCDLSPEKDSQHGQDCTIELCGLFVNYQLMPTDRGFLNWQNGYAAKFTLNDWTQGATITGVCPKSGATGSIQVP
jgi:hypothetical protein